MKKFLFISLALFTLPVVAFAATDFKTFVYQIVAVVILLTKLLMAVAVLVFFWGLAKFILGSGDPKRIEEGKAIMIWGTLGLFVMVSIWGILGLLYGELQLGGVVPRIQFLPTRSS